MSADERDVLIKIHERMARQETIMTDLVETLKGHNGKPGIIDQLNQVKTAHEKCLEKRLEEKAQKDVSEKKKFSFILATCTALSTAIGLLLPQVGAWIKTILTFLASVI
jgi:hypothetical protein